MSWARRSALAAVVATVLSAPATAAAFPTAWVAAVAHPAASPPTGAAAPAPAAPRPGSKVPASDAKLVGQRIMVGFDGTQPPSWLLARVRAGQVGSVILFAPNLVDSQQVSALTGALQRAARAGGNPPLLIATDQEGGQVKRF